jgi:ribonuclease Y
LKTQEARLGKREDALDRKLDTLSVKEKQLDDLQARLGQRETSLTAKEEQLNQILRQQRDQLLQLTNLSPEAAKELLLKRVEEECKLEVGAMIQRTVEHAQDEAKEKSRQIILQAIQRYAAEQTSDHTVSTVAIPSDDMKGRVICDRPGRAKYPEF